MERKGFAFGKRNFVLVGVAVAVIVVGFALMSGGGEPEGGTAFSAAVFSVRRIVIAPVVTMVGFGLMAVGILYRVKGE